MVKSRLYRGTIKMGIAFPEAFANWRAPTAAELNGALSFDLTPALVETGSKFDLDSSTSENYLPFNSTTGQTIPTFYQPNVIYEFNRSVSPTAADQANLAYQLLQFSDSDYFAWLRIGLDAAIPFSTGERVSMVRVSTDWPVENIGSGKNLTMTQVFLPQGDLIWQYTLQNPPTFTVVDNGDGTYTGYGAITDNGDGTYSIINTITDAGSGVLSFTG